MMMPGASIVGNAWRVTVEQQHVRDLAAICPMVLPAHATLCRVASWWLSRRS
jgi:hypothetical protein